VRILLVDHGCCDPPHARVHQFQESLASLGVEAVICGPSTVSNLERQPPGMFGIHLHDVAAASRGLLEAVRGGDPDAFVAAVATVPSRLLGLVRETARQILAEAADLVYPDAIFVLHASLLTDLAVETGAPVAVHVAAADLAATRGRPSLRRLVTGAVGSCGVIAGENVTTVAAVRDEWLRGDDDGRCEAWPLGADRGEVAERIADACRRVIARRRGMSA
jgi:hypothetical protein